MMTLGKPPCSNVCSHIPKAFPCRLLVITVSLTLLAIMALGCSSQPDAEKASGGAPMDLSSQAVATTAEPTPGIPNSSTGSAPSTPEELKLASTAAEELNVPYNGSVICTIGEPFYSEEFGVEVRSISFYENGKLCAGADCTEDGTLVGNFVYY